MSAIATNVNPTVCESDNQQVPGKVVEVVDSEIEVKSDEKLTQEVKSDEKLTQEVKSDEKLTQEITKVDPPKMNTPKLITVKISDSAKLKYQKHSKIGGGEDYLYLQNPLEVTFPEKLKVEINGIKFEAVFDWRTSTNEVAGTATKCEIPVGIHFIHASIGIPFGLALAQEVELPDRCPILLPAGTHLQQFSETPGLNLRVTLDFECEAFLIR
ncbi:hypothetical protein ma189 [Moumouvirus australiensis]|uniref:Uncharacterized protein n=1 Tax=Moumouvirus australiensis TaxID=2109587 RepID=A0A2P1EL24_9VIRU|nr:hypothetical protein QKC55_gp715 [Moumouvirus australiensis]AVL94575.1 hypothetical protein ma189 [Moumouvirus australiensis]